MAAGKAALTHGASMVAARQFVASVMAVVGAMTLAAALMGQSTAPASRPAMPDPSAQSQAEKLIRELFKEEYASKSPSQRQKLARKLLQQGMETGDDPAARFVLWREARDLAAAAGDAATALRAIDQLADSYDVPADEMRLTALSVVGRSATGSDLETAVNCEIDLLDQAVARDDYELAQRLLALAEAAARRARNVALLTTVQDRAGEVRDLQQQYQRAQAAIQTLRQKPEDAEARLAAGVYACLAKGDWEKGLPLLAESGDADLKALAQRDLAAGDDPAAQVQAGHGWWDLAQGRGRLARRQLRLRAAFWYARAVPKLAGLGRSVAEKRLEEVEAEQLQAMHLAPGLVAEIFAGQDFSRRLLTRIDPQVNFDWGKEAAGEGLPKDNFSIRWTGRLKISAAGRYTFIVSANSGARFVLDGQTLVESPTLWRKRNGERVTMELAEGLHPIRIEFWDGGGEANMKLLWLASEGGAEEPVTAKALYHSLLDNPD